MTKGLIYIFTGDGKGPPAQRCLALTAYSLQFGGQAAVISQPVALTGTASLGRRLLHV